MFFDWDFLNLELRAAQEGAVPPALPASSVFHAIAFHEKEMGRPLLDGPAFEAYLAAAAAGNENCWGLSALFQRREKLREIMAWLEQNQDFVTQVIGKWLPFFTSAPVNPDLRCVLYVGTRDGGFKLEGSSETVYLNLPAISCKEAFYETIAHESYHARRRSPQGEETVRQLEASDDYIGGVLYFTFEEGIAEFIGYNGFPTTKYPVLCLRSPEDGAEELRQLLWRYVSGELPGQELYQTFRLSDCCYTAGVTIADAVWASLGREGLDLWSVHYDRRAFYEAFLSTPQGRNWPELLL